MKEKLTLRNIIVWGGAFTCLVIFCLSFAARGRFVFMESSYIFDNIIWQVSHIRGYYNGEPMVDGYVDGKPFALPIIGVILLLIASLGAVAITFFLKKEKLSKILLIVAGGLALTGGIFIFTCGESVIRTFYYLSTETLDGLKDYKDTIRNLGGTWGPKFLPIFLGILGTLSGIAIGVAPFLPEKKLAK